MLAINNRIAATNADVYNNANAIELNTSEIKINHEGAMRNKGTKKKRTI